MKKTAPQFELSYYLCVMKWDGKSFSFDKKALEDKLKTFNRTGIRWIGIDGINLMETFSTDLDQVIEIAGDLFHKYNVRLSSLHYAGPTYDDPGKSQSEMQEHLVNYVERFKSWKPRALVIHACWPLGFNNGNLIVKEYLRQERKYGEDKVLRTIAGNLRKMAITAEKYKINLAIETMGRFLPAGGLESLPKLIKMINRPNAGYCIDSGHSHCFGESVAKWVEIASDKLYETHFHDNRGLGKNLKGKFVAPSHNLDEHMPAGFGTISWIDVINALRKIKFKGPVTFETGGFPFEEPVESYKLAIRWWRSCEKLAQNIS